MSQQYYVETDFTNYFSASSVSNQNIHLATTWGTHALSYHLQLPTSASCPIRASNISEIQNDRQSILGTI